jgi:hypothetical protein
MAKRRELATNRSWPQGSCANAESFSQRNVLRFVRLRPTARPSIGDLAQSDLGSPEPLVSLRTVDRSGRSASLVFLGL